MGVIGSVMSEPAAGRTTCSNQTCWHSLGLFGLALSRQLLLVTLLLAAGVISAAASPTRRDSYIDAVRVSLDAGKRHATISPLRPALTHAAADRHRGAQHRLDRSWSRTSVRLLPVVVVDAGHGGRDGGAVGSSGTLEKTVALATARELGRRLKATGRYRVVFTRVGDTFVPLAERVRVAVASGAALMVSIHADASADRTERGASVYIRPTDSSNPGVVYLSAHRGEPHAIAQHLSKLSLPHSYSANLQTALIASLDDDVGMRLDPARQGRFYVLGALGIPSVLVEMGFITNRQDEDLLRQPKHRAMVARAIIEALDEFFIGRYQPAT